MAAAVEELVMAASAAASDNDMVANAPKTWGDVFDGILARIRVGEKFNRYNVTPPAYDFYGAVEEARGFGIPIASFGNTRDKIVIHPGHLGYNFNYFWGQGHWASASCWDVSQDSETEERQNDASRFLDALALYLQKERRMKVWRVWPSGNDKGHLSTRICKGAVLDKDDKDLQCDTEKVLFVFLQNPLKDSSSEDEEEDEDEEDD